MRGQTGQRPRRFGFVQSICPLLAQSRHPDRRGECPLSAKAEMACAITTHSGNVQHEHAAARSCVIDTGENVFKNTNNEAIRA
jgi:hypothetical protein